MGVLGDEMNSGPVDLAVNFSAADKSGPHVTYSRPPAHLANFPQSNSAKLPLEIWTLSTTLRRTQSTAVNLHQPSTCVSTLSTDNYEKKEAKVLMLRLSNSSQVRPQ